MTECHITTETIIGTDGYARVTKNGNSLCINITDELKLLGIQPGEYVKFIIEKLDC